MTQFERDWLVKNIEYDVAEYARRAVALNNMGNGTIKHEDNVWMLTRYMELIVQHSLTRPNFNILTEAELDTMLVHIEKIVNKDYNLKFNN